MCSLALWQDNEKLDRPRKIQLDNADSIRVVATAELRKKILTQDAQVMKRLRAMWISF